MLLLLIALALLHGGEEVYRVVDREDFIQAAGSDRTTRLYDLGELGLM